MNGNVNWLYDIQCDFFNKEFQAMWGKEVSISAGMKEIKVNDAQHLMCGLFDPTC